MSFGKLGVTAAAAAFLLTGTVAFAAPSTKSPAVAGQNGAGAGAMVQHLRTALQGALNSSASRTAGRPFDEAQRAALSALQEVIVLSGAEPYVVEQALGAVTAPTRASGLALDAVRSRVLLALVQCPAPEQRGAAVRRVRNKTSESPTHQACVQGLSVSSISGFAAAPLGSVPDITGAGGSDYRPIR